ncbi:TPA: DeoR/GlpR transcriptional regulator [Bacillus cereus]|uniref:DeoR/GlpR family DNA-binding transcription regulator n=1 Tax=Bacillus cereus group TaxID=86661 RepID=UPI000BEB8C5F|nr:MULTISPECIES: DeoR/GlpR family DNA-binding transcription regulator [Bacillus cereus group]KAA0828643.1 DeoR/GlpR transcriptional regulator [Bacillus sp. AY2-1]KAA6461378.1 DeoR/GlpR transcriptional regulator [Bacillus cereus]KAA6470746.1 DeoR/GlpR transcriptional regulator [Bacillus cereus]KAB2414373.1 DeoR/GlpR transcriptional regulator [Bacillus cereus]KAB2435958.1 DeoR/GlpR transcriptional regulator [Bacillus cereus]
MNQEERLIRVFNYLETQKTMNIKQMCEMFHISRDTARRDIVKLSKNKAIVRTYGGVALATFHKKIDTYQKRSQTELATKKLIGMKAANIIANNDMIYLDVSTTVNFVAQHLQSKNVTIVTNSIDTAYMLAQSEDTTIHLLGGTLNKVSRHTTGTSTTEKLKDYHFDKVFIGTAGITEDGIYYGFEEDIYFKRELIKHADRVILVADHTKWNQRRNYKGLMLESIDTFITNQVMSDDLYNILKENGVEVVIASEV